jgi:hypothetical protein
MESTVVPPGDPPVGDHLHRAILTASSTAYEPSLLALVGSLNLNWPSHPPVIAYDLGMTSTTCSRLRDAGVIVRAVDAFCSHWRSHFAWRFWCMKEMRVRAYFWLDAGVCVLRPLDEVFAAIETLGYFCSTNHWPLSSTTTAQQAALVGFDEAWVRRSASIDAGLHGLLREGAGLRLIERGYEIALDEANLRATKPLHRHEQSLMTMLLHRFFDPVLYADSLIYGGWASPAQTVNQKLWVHRGRMLREDLSHFAAHLTKKGEPYLPAALPEDPWLLRVRKSIARARGRAPKTGPVVYYGIKD